ncbi:hypothetical protein OG292_19695 [Streptomyces sp. NBC_01511]
MACLLALPGGTRDASEIVEALPIADQIGDALDQLPAPTIHQEHS